MNFHSNERIALFIDGSNLYATARALGFDVDYKSHAQSFWKASDFSPRFLLYSLNRRSEILADPPAGQLAWLQWLHDGDQTDQRDPTGRRKIKGNMDIELAIDVMEMLEHLDHIVLFSGDGDFRRLVEVTLRKGKRATVISTVKSKPPMVADELRRQSDYFIELQDLQHEIAHKGGQSDYLSPHHNEDDLNDDEGLMPISDDDEYFGNA